MAVNPRDDRKLMNHADQAGELDIELIQFTPFGRVPVRPFPRGRFQRLPFARFPMQRFPFRRFQRFPFERFPMQRFPFRQF
jgi:hypothetical protein